MKNFRQRLVAFVAGIVLGPAVVWAGLETGTYISDLVATNPLSSDLASTADDHIRLLKSTIKTTFPNINGAVTVTDEQLNTVATNVAANPTATIGLTAVNGSAATYLRSDGAPALSQAIAPTWTAQHIFGLSFSTSPALSAASALPMIEWDETDGAANNQHWWINASGETLQFQIANDARNSSAQWLTVDRTGTTVDSVTFPTQTAGGFVVGSLGTVFNSSRMHVRTTTATAAAAQFVSPTATGSTVFVQNEATSGDNIFITFLTEAGGGGTTRGSIDFNRAGTLTRYNTTSDIRLKKNFKPAPSARTVIDCVKIESFDWKESGQHVDHGVVAQRLNRCAPYAVSKGDVWQVDKSTLIPAMIKYMQEQDARIAQQEARIRKIEAAEVGLLIKEVEELRHRMASLENQNAIVQFNPEPLANRGSITYNRAGGIVQYGVASDKRLKEDAKSRH